MSAPQLDLFSQPPAEFARAHPSEDVTNVYVPPEGPPEYQAAHEMLKFVDYLKLNEWQRKVLWPHLKWLIEDVMPSAAKTNDKDRLRFELGYVVGTLEVEQLRSRAAARQITEKYGITF